VAKGGIEPPTQGFSGEEDNAILIHDSSLMDQLFSTDINTYQEVSVLSLRDFH
jgi:hypothetical protein